MTVDDSRIPIVEMDRRTGKAWRDDMGRWAANPKATRSDHYLAYSEEKFTSLREEGHDLFQLHWFEATADQTVPLDLDWATYEALERQGMLFCLTARREGELVGYAIYALYWHPHYKTRLIADSDAFFLTPGERRGLIGARLLKEAEARLKAKGVAEIWNRVKLHVRGQRRRTHDLQPLMMRLGFRPVETVLRKRLR